LLAAPRAASRFYPRSAVPVRVRGQVNVRQLLPDPIPGSEIARMEFAPLARLTGVPHTPGTREYLTCESGEIDLVVGGRRSTCSRRRSLVPGRPAPLLRQPHARDLVGYSVVLLAPLANR